MTLQDAPRGGRMVRETPGETAKAGSTDPAAEGAPAKPPTIYDVARVAGVSHQTVSRLLRGYEGIRPQTKTRVMDALQELGYRPNLAARSLTTGRSQRIGALTHEIDQVGPSKIAQGASVAARQAGYLLDIVTLDMSNADAINDALELIMQHDLAGVLALASTDEMTQAFEAADFRVPAYIAAEEDDAFSNRRSELTSVGLPALIAHLAGLGHRTLLHIAGSTTYSAARNRRRAYEAAVADLSLHSQGVVYGDWSARSGYEAITGLRGKLEATAVVAANDQMALGAMLALTEQGYRIPEDISVAGIDDIPEAGYFSPPLTTLRVNFAAQGRNAVQQLLGQIEGFTPPSSTGLTSQLITRRSTGPAPGTAGHK
ncbi:LacI family DNA-binding transcriptional regulator [Arthrobacter sp. ISL-30]|nr:LacI family DNA-binding transcriptional regulator [Arthrobacter sp. ISL-30]